MKTIIVRFSLLFLILFVSEAINAQELSSPASVSVTRNSIIKEKSVAKGMLLSVGSTVLPTVVGVMSLHRESNIALGTMLLGSGGIMGPSMGNFYAGDKKRGMIGAAVRLGAWLLVSGVTTGGTWDENGSSAEEITILGALIVSFGTAVWNIAIVPVSVRQYNLQQREKFSLQPMINPPEQSIGLNLAIRL